MRKGYKFCFVSFCFLRDWPVVPMSFINILKIHLKIKLEIPPLPYAKFFYLWTYVSLFMDCLWLSVDLSLCSWSSTRYFILWLYNVLSYLVSLILPLPLLICFKTLLAILKCLLFFYMNFIVNLSTFNRNSGW